MLTSKGLPSGCFAVLPLPIWIPLGRCCLADATGMWPGARQSGQASNLGKRLRGFLDRYTDSTVYTLKDVIKKMASS